MRKEWNAGILSLWMLSQVRPKVLKDAGILGEVWVRKWMGFASLKGVSREKESSEFLTEEEGNCWRLSCSLKLLSQNGKRCGRRRKAEALTGAGSWSWRTADSNSTGARTADEMRGGRRGDRQ